MSVFHPLGSWFLWKPFFVNYGRKPKKNNFSVLTIIWLKESLLLSKTILIWEQDSGKAHVLAHAFLFAHINTFNICCVVVTVFSIKNLLHAGIILHSGWGCRPYFVSISLCFPLIFSFLCHLKCWSSQHSLDMIKKCVKLCFISVCMACARICFLSHADAK